VCVSVCDVCALRSVSVSAQIDGSEQCSLSTSLDVVVPALSPRAPGGKLVCGHSSRFTSLSGRTSSLAPEDFECKREPSPLDSFRLKAGAREAHWR
jgi:hypothetical protein